jgi:hypothetical protein
MIQKVPESTSPQEDHGNGTALPISPSQGSRVGWLGVAVRGLLTCVLLFLVFVTFDGKSLLTIVHEQIPFVPAGLLALIGTGLLALALVFLWRSVITIDSRFHAPLLITCILAVGHATYGILENHYSPFLDRLTDGFITTYSPTFIAIASSILIEIILSKTIAGKWPHLASAYIGGISVGILIKSPELWPFVLCAVLSIASKYAIRVKGRHLWNPSNLGVTLMLFIAPDKVAPLSVQAGNDIWPVIIIWILGSLILYRLNLVHIPICFVTAFVVLAFFRSRYTGDPYLTEISPMTSPMFMLFIFFMITDPKTITRAKWSQCVVAVLVAIMENQLRMMRDIHSLFHSLFIVGPITNLIEIWWMSRKCV